MIVLAGDGAIAHLNPAGEHHLAVRDAAARGRSIAEFVHPADRHLLAAAPDTAAAPPVVVRFRTSTGAFHSWAVRISNGTDHAAVRGTVLVGRPHLDPIASVDQSGPLRPGKLKIDEGLSQ